MTTLLIFILGTAIGSFLNVLIDRIPAGEGVVKGRSYCDSCRHQLAWYDLIPLLSWVMLRGRCRYCKARISLQYPIIELSSGFTFLLSYSYIENLMTAVTSFSTNYGLANPSNIVINSNNVINIVSNTSIANNIVNIGFIWFILSALLVIFVVDLKHYFIPDKILYPTILVVLIYRFAQLVAQGSRLKAQGLFSPVSSFQFPVSGSYSILSSLGAVAFFLILVILTRGKGMGLGDVKFALLMGLLLGWPGIIVGMYTAFLTGAVASVILILLGKKKFGEHIPFGPFLVSGTMGGMFWGENLWNIFWSWY